MVSFWPAGTDPVARVWLVNGAALPARGVAAGVAALANPPPARVVPATAAVAPSAAMNFLVLDMVPLSVSVSLTCPGSDWQTPVMVSISLLTGRKDL